MGRIGEQAARPQDPSDRGMNLRPVLVREAVDSVKAEEHESKRAVGEYGQVTCVRMLDPGVRVARTSQAHHLLQVVDGDVVVAQRAKVRESATSANTYVEDRLAANLLGETLHHPRLPWITPAVTAGEDVEYARPLPHAPVGEVYLGGQLVAIL